MLSVGTVVDRYEIQEIVGSGGMAVVYRALHRELRSEHAIKILKVPRGPIHERLLAEGQTQASLNHPNVVAVTDVVRLEGATALVMEYIDGPTLDDYLNHERPSVEQLDDLARGIVAGVGAAHEFGSVHRDLKPGNILLAIRKGVIEPKITDFGLVKILDAEDQGLSVTGTGLGTPSYMAPEQIQNAKYVDKRADIFSLGCVLYEMVCGQRAFEGASMFETFQFITQGTYTPVRALRPDVPIRMEKAIEGCLKVDPDERIKDCMQLSYMWFGGKSTSLDDTWDPAALERARRIAQDATEEHRSKATYGAISVNSEDMRPATSEQPKTVISDVEMARQGSVGPSWTSVAMLFSAFVGFVAVGVPAMLFALERDVVGPLDKPNVNLPLRPKNFRKLTHDYDVEKYPTLSPDGKEVVYVDGDGTLVTQRVAGGEARAVFPAHMKVHATQPAFSPDGSTLAFVRTDASHCGIYVAGMGGMPRKVVNGGYAPEFSRDGKKLVFSTASVLDPMIRTKLGTLEMKDLDSLEGPMVNLMASDAVEPTFSPSGTRVAFWRFVGGERELWTVRSDGEDAKHVDTGTRTHWSPVWTTRGIYYVSDHGGAAQVWMVDVDEETGEASAPAEPITTGAAQSMWHMSASADGERLLYVSHSQQSRVARLDLDLSVPEVTKESPVAKGRHLERPDISPDGTQIALMQYGEQEDLYIVGVDGEGLFGLTNDKFRDRSPRWSPDGTRIAFFSNRNDAYELYTIRPDGSGLKRHTEVGEYLGAVWAPDGQSLVARSNIDKLPWRIPLDGSPAELLSERQLSIYDWAPDGSFLAGFQQGGQVQGTFLLAPEFGSDPRKIADFPSLPRFLNDSRRLLLATNQDLILFDPDAAPKSSAVWHVEAPDWIAGLAVSRDNTFAVVSITKTEGDLWTVELVP
jgi:eukaryotic-like serine/threonine-protein kinase